VDSASGHVDEVSRHFSDAIEKAREPETNLELLKKATIAAPIGMLVTAFIAGALFGSPPVPSAGPTFISWTAINPP
jgi:hypothetical protein